MIRLIVIKAYELIIICEVFVIHTPHSTHTSYPPPQCRVALFQRGSA